MLVFVVSCCGHRTTHIFLKVRELFFKICFSDSLIKKHPNFLCKDYFHLKFPISPVAQVVKNLLAMQETKKTQAQSLSGEEEITTHSSILA